MKNFYEIDSQLVKIDDELKDLQSKSEGIIWVKYIAIAIGMGLAGALALLFPVSLVFAAINWIIGVFGGDLPKGPGTVLGGILKIVSLIGFFGGLAFAIRWGIAGSQEMHQRFEQLHRSMQDLQAKRSDYLRSSID